MNWYDMPGALDGFENNPAYHEKMEVETDHQTEKVTSPFNYKAVPVGTNSWIKKREFKKKMVRRFLTINPGMDYSKLYGDRCVPAIYICTPNYNNGDYYDPRVTYSFNPYTHVFLSRRGDIRKYHGVVSVDRNIYVLSRRDKTVTKAVNRKIRHMSIDEDASVYNAVYKKIYGNFINGIW